MHPLLLGWQTSRPARDISALLFLCSHKSSPQPHPLAPGFLLWLGSSLIGVQQKKPQLLKQTGNAPCSVLWEHFPVTVLAGWSAVGAEHTTDSVAKDNREISAGFFSC